MTPADFKGRLRAMGLTPRQPTVGGAYIYEDRDGDMVRIPDPGPMTPDQREAFIELLMARGGYSLDN